VYAPVRRIEHRGSVLNIALLTVRLTAPLPGVIGIEVTHHAGGMDRGPHFELTGDGTYRPETDVVDEAAEIRSGPLTARVSRRGPWRLQFRHEDRVLTTNGDKALGFVDTPAGEHHMFAQLSLGVGETVYGLGERFTAFVKNGQVVDTWNTDPGTASEQAYKSIPFYLSSRGYGVLVADPGRVSFEVASENTSATQFSVEGQTLRFYVVDGPTPAGRLEGRATVGSRRSWDRRPYRWGSPRRRQPRPTANAYFVAHPLPSRWRSHCHPLGRMTAR